MPLYSQAQSSEYDPWFKAYTARYLYGLLPDDDWRWLKAQAIQESRLDPNAVSHANAAGIMQIIPAAALDARLYDRFDPEQNIRAGAWLLRRNIRTWWPRDTPYQRLQLGWASYNAGAGNIIKAQTRSGGKMLWPDIAPHLSAITGHDNARETLHYVQIIPQHYRGIRD